MHNRYESECFVFKSYSDKESSRTYILFSKELGLIYAKAQGIELPASKLRASLEAPAKSKVSLVRGKEIWRIVGAEKVDSLWHSLRNNREALMLMSRLFSLTKRMLPKEERHEEIYSIMEDCLEALSRKNEVDDYEVIELLGVSRILHHLGYFILKREYESFFGSSLISLKTEQVLKSRRQLVFDINQI